MTILEMLDRLETEILSLREARASAVLTGSNGAAAEETARPARKQKRRKLQPKKAKQSKRSKVEVAGEQLALPVASGMEGETAPVTGKRRALGRSLLHLRKLAAAARNSSSA